MEIQNTPVTKRGKLISIEGIDGVGKNTQAKLLQKLIEKEEGECALYSFPQYETETGKLVKEYLTTGRNDLDLYGRAKLYADDRLAARDEIIAHLERGVSVVCDRYTHSNIVYFEQFARMNKPELFGVIGEQLWENEFIKNKLPQIDQMFTLSVSLGHYDGMMESKGEREYTTEKLDRHEADIELMKGCHELYGFYGKREGALIQCDVDGKLMSVEFIAGVIQLLYSAFKEAGNAITGIKVAPYKMDNVLMEGIKDGYSARVIEEKMNMNNFHSADETQMDTMKENYKAFVAEQQAAEEQEAKPE